MDLTFTDLDGAIYEINGIVLSGDHQNVRQYRRSAPGAEDSGGTHLPERQKGTEYEQYVRVTRHGNNSVNIEFIGSKYAYSEIDDLRRWSMTPRHWRNPAAPSAKRSR